MTNLMLTNQCTQHCSYCFAGTFLHETPAVGSFVSFETFRSYIDFLDRSGLDQVRLLGGEPTLHPQFGKLVEYACSHGKKVIVFSNGLIPETGLRALLELPPQRCTVLVNLAAGKPQAFARHRQANVMSQLGQKACPGYTVSCVNEGGLEWLLDMIDESGCQRSLRIALAQPAADARNAFIHPKQYRTLAPQICALATQAHRRGVRLEFDCGFVRCMFSDDEMRSLQVSGVSPSWYCSPVLDIAVDGTAFSCFALAEQMQIPGSLASNATELRKEFDTAFAVMRIAGIFPECSTCALRVTEKCSGGCLSAALRRMRPASVNYILSAQDSMAFMNL